MPTASARKRYASNMPRLLLLCAVLAAGCKKTTPAPTEAGTTAPPAEVPLQPIGTADPFIRLSPEAQKALDRARKDQRAKKWDEAQKELRSVIATAPDWTPAQWMLVRALLSGGQFADVPSVWEPLIARDFAAYAHRLDADKAATTFRNAPEWAKLQALSARYKDAWAKGLDRGFFFVARTRAAAEPQFAAGKLDAPLALHQEIFHYDPEAKRFRRLTETDGQAFAIDRAPDGKSLAFLCAGTLHRENGADSFMDPKVGWIDLTTLETVGPFPMKGRFDQVVLATNASKQPLFTFVTGTGASVTYTIDTARTGLSPLTGGAVIPDGGETRAWPNQVAHVDGKQIEGVTITDGSTQFSLAGVATPVLAARPIAQSTLEWSPHKTRLTYAGKLDACRVLKATVPGGDKNELYVYDITKHAAQRVAASVSFFETLWLDDDRLAYEGGVGKEGAIHLYNLPAHADQALPTRHGAGLYGVPTLACEQAETGVDEDLGESNEEGD
jgi:hypothetical protein